MQGTTLGDFIHSGKSDAEKQVKFCFYVAPFVDLTLTDVFEMMPDEVQAKSSKSGAEIRDEMQENQECISGGVRFRRITDGREIIQDLEKAGSQYIPSDNLCVFIASLSCFDSLAESVNSIERILGYNFVSYFCVIEAYFGIQQDEKDVLKLLRHLRDDVPFELSTKDRQQDILDSISDTRHKGRPPVGFEVESGRLIPADDYQRVCDVLRMVDAGGMSKRQASQQIEASPRTITRILSSSDRREMYFS